MMPALKRILPHLCTLALAAQSPLLLRGPQVWEGDRTVLTALDEDHTLSFISRSRDSLVSIAPKGQPALELRLPPNLGWPRVSHWKQRSFAYGFPAHPAWHFPDLGKQAWSFPPKAFSKAYEHSEHHLYQSTDYKTWHLLGRYRSGEDTHGKLREILPLEDGSFLAFGIFGFWELDRSSPVARYYLDGRGHLRFEGLIELGSGGLLETIPHPTLPGQKSTRARAGYEGIERQDWVTARTREGLVLIHRGGWFFVLDNHDGRQLREGRIPAPKGTKLRVLDAEPDATGRILLASTRLRGKDEATLAPFPQPRDSESQRLARSMMLMKGRNRRLVNDLEGSTPITWHHLEPASGRLTQVAPPENVSAELSDGEARWTFCFTIRPDGNLEVFQRPAKWLRLGL